MWQISWWHLCVPCLGCGQCYAPLCGSLNLIHPETQLLQILFPFHSLCFHSSLCCCLGCLKRLLLPQFLLCYESFGWTNQTEASSRSVLFIRYYSIYLIHQAILVWQWQLIGCCVRPFRLCLCTVPIFSLRRDTACISLQNMIVFMLMFTLSIIKL